MEIKNAVLAGLVFGILFGLFLAVRFRPYYALLAYACGQVASLSVGYTLTMTL